MIRSPELTAAREVIRADKRERAKESKAERLARAREHLKAAAGLHRKPRERNNAHLAYIRRLPCVATYAATGELLYGVDACHVRFADAPRGKPFTGAGRKPDDKWVLPMVRAEHERQHSMAERSFYEGLSIDALTLCQLLYGVSGDVEAGVRIIKGARS